MDAVKGIKQKRQARAGRKRQVYAPVEKLNRLIAEWNRLLDLCEQRVLVPAEQRREAVALRAHLMADLSKYRKTPPAASEG